jgi:hypothetical protein
MTTITTVTAHSWIRDAARLGHLSSGVVYVVVGLVTLAAAVTPHLPPRSAQGALRHMFPGGLGTIALIGIGIGLIVDAMWQVVRASTDADVVGRGMRGIAERIGWLFAGLVHLGLGVAAIKIAFGVPQVGGERQARGWTAFGLSLPFGRWLVAGAAIATIGVALVLLVRAATGDVDKRIDWQRMSHGARMLARGLGQFGMIARAIVYAVIGGFLLRAALEASAQQTRGVAGAFRAIRDEPYGWVILAFIALGFIANGVLEFVRARYRRIDTG